jgi:transposase
VGFTNKRCDLLKVFWWDDGGMVVMGKRLHEGTFKAWPQNGQKIVRLTAAELPLLLSGLDVGKLRPRRWVRRSPDDQDAACNDAATALRF